MYPSYEDIKAMYYYYAVESGFDVKKTTIKKPNGVLTLQYFVCNREGQPNTTDVDTLDYCKGKYKKRVDIHRRGCRARVICRIVPGTCEFEFHEVEERHNHTLYRKELRHMSLSKRKLDDIQKKIIQNMSYQNVGASKAHRLYYGLQGSFQEQGGNMNDFKNFMRDLNCFIGGSDAQMLKDKMEHMRDNVSNFSFEVRAEPKKLKAMFWADETSKIHYKEFGHVVSFDATYDTNRYDLIFVPFTGIDNHQKCVTFGAGLLTKEDTDSYVWLLECFLRAFEKEPVLVLTDQDAAMLIAINKVFPNTNHRLCMWHITSKLQSKVCSEIYNDSEFRDKFNSLVWNSKIDDIEFEEGWASFISEYNLTEVRWFKDMYKIRHKWIPAYFKHIPMSGLMRTTSRSECQNFAFQHSINGRTRLVNFMIGFETSMEKQRHVQSELEFRDTHKIPRMRTGLEIEKNALKYYTRSVFRQVQKEIEDSLLKCCQTNRIEAEDVDTCVILEMRSSRPTKPTEEDKEAHIEWDENLNDKEFKVTVNKKEETLVCSCMKFEQYGVLCRHIFCVMKYYRLTDIPEKYILRRWRKDIIPIEMIVKTFKYGHVEDGVQNMSTDAISSVNACVSSLIQDKIKLQEYVKQIKILEVDILAKSYGSSSLDKKAEFEKLLGVTTPTVVDLENPDNVRTKGCGTRKRFKSSKEISIAKQSRVPRTCTVCKKKALHDARNCPDKKKDEASHVKKA